MYAGELLPRLSRLLSERGHQVVTYAPGPLRGAVVRGEVRVVPGAPYWTQRVLPRALFRDRPDLLFLPIQMLPLRRPRGMRTVCVVHDLEFLSYPETYTLQNRFLLRFFTRHAVRNATGLIAVSQYTKEDVVRTYGRRAEDITVVHHGVDHASFQPPASSLRSTDEDVRRRCRIPGRYVLYVGSLQPRKNVAGLVTAFEQLSTFHFPFSLHLVLVAGGAWKEEPILQRIARSPARGRMQLARHVPQADLPAIYRGAEVFVLPSFSEGFGMPVLEAMACGTPVVCSSTSSLPEVAGAAALFADPKDPRAIAAAIARVLGDDRLRADLRARGLARARQFSWDHCADQTAALLASAQGAGQRARRTPSTPGEMSACGEVSVLRKTVNRLS